MPLRRRTGWMAAATAALLLAVLLSLAVGSREIPPSQVFDALLHGGTSQNAEVVRSLRVPRTVIGLMVGAALGGRRACVMQGVTRNPIAEPGILGRQPGRVARRGVRHRRRRGGHARRLRLVRLRGRRAAAVAVYAVAAARPGRRLARSSSRWRARR